MFNQTLVHSIKDHFSQFRHLHDLLRTLHFSSICLIFQLLCSDFVTCTIEYTFHPTSKSTHQNSLKRRLTLHDKLVFENNLLNKVSIKKLAQTRIITKQYNSFEPQGRIWKEILRSKILLKYQFKTIK